MIRIILMADNKFTAKKFGVFSLSSVFLTLLFLAGGNLASAENICAGIPINNLPPTTQAPCSFSATHNITTEGDPILMKVNVSGNISGCSATRYSGVRLDAEAYIDTAATRAYHSGDQKWYSFLNDGTDFTHASNATVAKIWPFAGLHGGGGSGSTTINVNLVP